MAILSLVLFSSLTGALIATHCDKNLVYHDSYSYGTDITCEDLSDDNEELLKNIGVSKEIVLSIYNSNLTQVSSSLFANVPKIKFLIVENSTFTFETDEPIFNKFERLEHLTVKNTKFNNLHANVLEGLDDLKELVLDNCSLTTIKNNTFNMFKKLEVLKLSNNRFKNMFDIPFCELPNLKHFSLDHNKVEQIEDNFIICFNEEEVTGFLLNGKDLKVKYHAQDSYNQAKSNLDLIEINLSHNKINKIVPFDWATGLRNIDLSNNRLKIINDSFRMLKELEKLNLENNLLEKIVSNAFDNLKNLKLISLQNNSLPTVSLKNLNNLQTIHLSKNKLTLVSLTRLNNLPNLRKLFLNQNKIEGLIENVFHNFTFLETLDLSDNKISLNRNSFANLSNLKELLIKNNNLETIPEKVFNKLKTLEVLDISSNKIEMIPFTHTFSGLGNLQVLNLSHNLLENLSYDLLKPLRNLQVLDISGNRLQNFPISLVGHLPSLQVISIKSNELSCGVLSTIITFLKSQNISYNINEEFEYQRENVAGIYCEEMDSKMLAQIESSGLKVSSAIGILFIVIVASVFFAFVMYKCLVYTRRRHYILDEIELL